jgi:hypothetical protein
MPLLTSLRTRETLGDRLFRAGGVRRRYGIALPAIKQIEDEVKVAEQKIR